MSHVNLMAFQADVGIWHRANFPDASTVEVALKACEEVGELAHACGKLYSKIGNFSKLRKQEFDAIGDMVIVLAAYCDMVGVDMGTAIADTWERVRMRDWQDDPVNGGKDKE